MATLEHLRASEYDSRLNRAEVTWRYLALRGLIDDDVQFEKESAEIEKEVDLSLKAKNLSKDKLLQANKKLFRRYVARAIISQGAKILKDLEEAILRLKKVVYNDERVKEYEELCHKQACLIYKYALCSQYAFKYGRLYWIIRNEVLKIEQDKFWVISVYDKAYPLIQKIETVYREQLNKKCSGFMEIYDKIMNEDKYANITDEGMSPPHCAESLLSAAYKTIGRCFNIERLDVVKLLNEKYKLVK